MLKRGGAVPPRTRIVSAIAYGTSSSLIMIANKLVLHTWKFPSVATLTLFQFIFAILCLTLLHIFHLVELPSPPSPRELFSRPRWWDLTSSFLFSLLYIGNALSGLGGTKALSLPMFTVLRRTNILMTMGLETWLLGRSYSSDIFLAIGVVLIGSILAASVDMRFDIRGYTSTMFNNLFTSTVGVMTKLQLDDGAGGSIWNLVFLNSLIGALILSIAIPMGTPHVICELRNYPYWGDPKFIAAFSLSVGMGVVLQISTVYCTKMNSPLTTVMVGVMKNVIVSYVGMMEVLGYTFSWMNFIGVNLSLLGGMWYTYVEYREKVG